MTMPTVVVVVVGIPATVSVVNGLVTVAVVTDSAIAITAHVS